MDHRLIEGLMEVVVPAVREYVDGALSKATEPLLAQIEELKAREPIKGEPGEPGKSVTIEDVQPLIVRSLSELTADAFEKNRAELNAALKALKPVDGKDGEPGERGADGKDADPAVIKLLVAEELAKIPPAIDGKDGVGLAGAIIDRDGELVVTLTDGTHHKLGCVVGKNGKRGEDGFGFEHMDETTEDGGRVVVRTYKRGEEVKEFRHVTATPIYRGVWQQRAYQWGDSVSHGGSCWTAQKDTETKPDTPDSDWRLSTKRGRDGKDFRPDVPREPTQVKFG